MTATHAGKRLLIVDADAHFRETLAKEFKRRGYDVATADSHHGYREIARNDFDYAAIDLKLQRGSGSGLKILEEIRQNGPSCRDVIVTSYGSIATAVRAIKLGAHDYLTKPTTAAAVEYALRGEEKYSGDVTRHAIEEVFPSLARQEREYIDTVLLQCGGNISEAARRLGIHRQSLQRKLRKYPPRK